MLGMGCSRKEDNNMWRKGKYMHTFKTNTRNKRGIISILLFIYNAEAETWRKLMDWRWLVKQ